MYIRACFVCNLRDRHKPWSMTEFKEVVKKFGRHTPPSLPSPRCALGTLTIYKGSCMMASQWMKLLLDTELLSCWANCLCLVFFKDLLLSTNHFLQLSVHDLWMIKQTLCLLKQTLKLATIICSGVWQKWLTNETAQQSIFISKHDYEDTASAADNRLQLWDWGDCTLMRVHPWTIHAPTRHITYGYLRRTCAECLRQQCKLSVSRTVEYLITE